MNQAKGKIKQIIGAVVDVDFKDYMPKIYDALEVNMPDGTKLVLEVQQHIGSNAVRRVAMGSPEGLSRGAEAAATGLPISVPVGQPTLGRMLNALGEPLDNQEPVVTEERNPINRESPGFIDQSTKTEILETGIKVIDLIAPIVKGGKVGMFGGAGGGKTVIIQELI